MNTELTQKQNDLHNTINKCGFENCQLLPKTDYSFCQKHLCKTLCGNSIKHTSTNYCQDHCCSYQKCNKFASINDDFCSMHAKLAFMATLPTCKFENCNVKIVKDNKYYCSDHKCQSRWDATSSKKAYKYL
jgi:hypothetical protein